MKKTESKSWIKINNRLYLTDTSSAVKQLENGRIYSLEEDEEGKLYLDEKNKYFSFPFKVYGLEENFIEKCITTYNNTTSNLGILLNGIKGTGKTITAEMLANKLDLPIILIPKNVRGINRLLSSIHQDITILIDEYEKVFAGNVTDDDEYDNSRNGKKDGDSTLLSLMDGTYSNSYRKVFLLTTNRTWLNENMMNRPGRIRYKKSFSDLNLSQIKQILDDLLVEKQFEQQIIDYMKPLDIITVDIVKAIISEVNIYKDEPSNCCADLNILFKDEQYEMIKITTTKENGTVMNGAIPAKIVMEIIQRPQSWNSAYIKCDDGSIYRNVAKPDLDKMVFKLKDHYDSDSKAFTVRLRKRSRTHTVFTC